MLELINLTVRRTRQHHAIEHAAIRVLSERFPNKRFSGYSDPLGFTILGDITSDQLRTAVGEALLRLQGGESELAIHPNCGTNLATTGVLTTVAALIGSHGRRSLAEKFTSTLLLVIAALLIARPLGHKLQHYTTLASVSDRWVEEISPMTIGGMNAHRVLFE